VVTELRSRSRVVLIGPEQQRGRRIRVLDHELPVDDDDGLRKLLEDALEPVRAGRLAEGVVGKASPGPGHGIPFHGPRPVRER